MNAKYPHLLSPIKLGNVTFRHRMFSAPMGATDITFDCSPGPRTQGFYELRAKGGAAAVTVSELVVHPSTDGSHMLHLNLTTPGNLAAHTYVADAIRRHGAVPSIEFSHSGQYAGTYLTDISNTDYLQAVEPGAKPTEHKGSCGKLLAMTLFGIIMRRHAWPAHQTGGAALGLKAVETLGICPWRLASLIRIVPLVPGAEINWEQKISKNLRIKQR